MNQIRNARLRIRAAAGVAAAAMLLLAGVAGSATPVYAQSGMTDPDAAVACGAFQRSGYGAWNAVAPTILTYGNGVVVKVAPGQTFSPNQMVGGIEVAATIDRHCGNM